MLTHNMNRWTFAAAAMCFGAVLAADAVGAMEYRERERNRPEILALSDRR